MCIKFPHSFITSKSIEAVFALFLLNLFHLLSSLNLLSFILLRNPIFETFCKNGKVFSYLVSFDSWIATFHFILQCERNNKLWASGVTFFQDVFFFFYIPCFTVTTHLFYTKWHRSNWEKEKERTRIKKGKTERTERKDNKIKFPRSAHEPHCEIR